MTYQQAVGAAHCEFIHPAGCPEVEYITVQQIEQCSNILLDQELRGIQPRLATTNHDKKKLMGLALSGGGIRSATFSLGVLQALAAKNVLPKMDYLSTVSGGGYIGSSLSWWLCKGKKVGLKSTNFPFGATANPDPLKDGYQEKRLRHLRQHGKFLAPGNGITFLSGISIVLRSTLLSLTVWLPALVFIMLLLIRVPGDWMATGRGLAGRPVATLYCQFNRASRVHYLRPRRSSRGGFVCRRLAPLFSVHRTRPPRRWSG